MDGRSNKKLFFIRPFSVVLTGLSGNEKIAGFPFLSNPLDDGDDDDWVSELRFQLFSRISR